jgi:uncharacterized 2Fe-2S/4Fe-4S cluster protein (DUF4445 family)
MSKYKVTFQPDNKTVEVEADTTLLQAAEKANVYINSLCGGEGLCGECRLQVMKGNARADKHAIGFFSAEELKHGYVLACQTKINDNLEVMIPARSRLEMEKIITEGTQVTYSEPTRETVQQSNGEPSNSFQPLVVKVYLELPEPTITDNISDIDRLTRELRKKLPYEHFEITLNCLRQVAEKLRQDSWKVTATVARHNNSGRVLQIEAGDTTDRNFGIALDIGTTTVVEQLIDLKTGKVLGVEGNHNLQAHYGEDVISRMVFACNHGSLNLLHQAVVTNIHSLTKELVRESNIDVRDISCIVAAGNTTMSHFLLELMPCSIRLEPYVPTASVYPQILARDIGIDINPDGVCEVLPSVSSYVGGDIVAGVLACGLADRAQVSCLIDVGTNGEIVVGNSEWMVCCSASAGPAFEGAGMKYGMRATKGAIEKVVISAGQVTCSTIADSKARGICGSGLIDTIYELRRNGIIGPDGKFNQSRKDKRLLLAQEEPEYIMAMPEETEIGQAITITESDIANLIKSKGAVFAAIKSLMDYIGMEFEQLQMIYLAGGFGSSLDIEKAVVIGLLPDIDRKRIQFIGNSALTGARIALLSQTEFEKAITISKRMTNIELSAYPPFMNEFIAALFLPHTDKKLFPSVKF